MAHFAEIDENNKVIRVLVTDNDDPNGDEGHQFLIDTFGGRWIQTSYNKKFRKNFAGVNCTYDETLDAFIPPKCHDEAILLTDVCLWKCENIEHEILA